MSNKDEIAIACMGLLTAIFGMCVVAALIILDVFASTEGGGK